MLTDLAKQVSSSAMTSLFLTDHGLPALSESQFERFQTLLTMRKDQHCLADGFRQRLDNIGHLYRSRLMQSISDRSRREDRAANARMAQLARCVASKLDHSEAPYAEFVSLLVIRPVPMVADRLAWINEFCTALMAIERHVEAGEIRNRHTLKLVEELQVLRLELACLDDDARVHLAFTLSASSAAITDEDWSGTLIDALECIAVGAERAVDAWKAKRGREPATAISLLAVDLYEAVVDARGGPAKLLLAVDGTYTGRPQNDDSRFLLEFVEWVHASLPDEIRARKPLLLQPSAIGDAYKEHSELMRRSSKLPA